jgi:hypothetical protein
LGNFSAGIIHIAGDDGVFGANHNTGGLQTQLGSVGAVVAFGGRIGVRVNINGIIRAGLHTSLAADADAGIEVDDAIFSLVHGRHRAYPYTGWVGTMVAAGDLKMAPVVGKDACFYIFDPGAINTQGHFIFAFTGGRTGVATNTLAIVNDEAVIHKFLLPRSLKLSNHALRITSQVS